MAPQGTTGKASPYAPSEANLTFSPTTQKGLRKAETFFVSSQWDGYDQLSLDWLILMPGPMVDAITQDLIY